MLGKILDTVLRRNPSRQPVTENEAPLVSFLCEAEDLGVIAEPVPARNALPDWLRRLPGVDDSVVSATNNGLTVKRCMPFLDAMTLGFILPLAASVRLDIRDGGRSVDGGWVFDQVMISNHGSHQVKGHPYGDRPPMKFHNYWTIRTPPGWSCLFVPPLNRPPLPFEVLAGVVDTDTYASLIHFPFFATGEDGVHTIAKGTPLVQVIPFKRSHYRIDATSRQPVAESLAMEIRPETEDEEQEKVRIMRNTKSVDGWYRNNARASRKSP